MCRIQEWLTGRQHTFTKSSLRLLVVVEFSDAARETHSHSHSKPLNFCVGLCARNPTRKCPAAAAARERMSLKRAMRAPTEERERERRVESGGDSSIQYLTLAQAGAQRTSTTQRNDNPPHPKTSVKRLKRQHQQTRTGTRGRACAEMHR